MLPDINGIELCKKVKSDESWRSIPILFLSGEIDTRTESEGLRAGAVDYIRKPFNIDIVLARVKTHLELKRHRDFLEGLGDQQTQQLRRAEAECIKLFLREKSG
jgi:DNA-binding response OmpR family regulator